MTDGRIPTAWLGGKKWAPEPATVILGPRQVVQTPMKEQLKCLCTAHYPSRALAHCSPPSIAHVSQKHLSSGPAVSSTALCHLRTLPALPPDRLCMKPGTL